MAKGTKTGGRQVGTPNRLTKELRASLKNIVYQELEALPDLLNKLKPRDKAEFLVKLFPYIFPKVDSVNYKENEPFNFSGDDLFE